MRGLRWWTPAFVVIVSFLPITSSLANEWPTSRHDEWRTGLSTGVGDIHTPVVAWSYYLGGALPENGVWFGDLDGDGAAEAAMLQAGKVALLSLEGAVKWRSEAIGAGRLVGAHDFDGDGRLELLVTRETTPLGLLLLDGRSGQILWRFEDYGMDAGAFPPRLVTVADLNGDGLSDIVAKPANGLYALFAFTFPSGFADDPLDNVLWTFTHQLYGNTIPYLVGDFDGDGSADVAFAEHTRLVVLRGADGAPLRTADGVWSSFSLGPMAAANIDDDPQEEFIAIGATYYNYAIVVYDALQGRVEWRYEWFPTSGKGLAAPADSIRDVTCDGRPDIVVSLYDDADDERNSPASSPADYDGVNAPDAWTLIVFDAATGEVLARLPNAYLRGLVDLDDDRCAEILAQTATPGTISVSPLGSLTAYSLIGGTLTARWALINATPARFPLPREPGRNESNGALAAAALDLGGKAASVALIWRDLDGDGRADALSAIDPTAAERDRWTIPETAGARLVATFEKTDDPDAPRAAVFLSTGEIVLLSAGLAPVGGMRTGGFSTSPLVADIDADGGPDVLTAASNGELVVLDPRDAALGRPPVLRWTWDGRAAPFLTTADLDGDGRREIPARDMRDPINPRLALLDAEGIVLWSRLFANYGSPLQQVTTGRFGGDETLDLLVVVADVSRQAGEDLRLVALDGRDGSELWNVPSAMNYLASEPILAADLDDDGDDDVILLDRDRIEYYDGADGRLLFGVSATNWSLASLLADLDADGALDLLVANYPKALGLQRFAPFAAEPIWSVAYAFDSEPGAAWPGIFPVDEGLGIILPSTRGALQAFDAEGRPFWDAPRFLRHGVATTNDPGDGLALAGVNVADVDGNGKPDALVGASDGYLMAVDALDADLSWSLPLRAPVGEPIAADLDGDGTLEVLVVAEDGFLYAIDEAALPAPQEVRDLAIDESGGLGDPSIDVDVTENPEALAAAWSSVPGAAGYRVAAIDEAGEIVSAYQDAGSATQMVLPVHLVLGRRYRILVTAYDAQGGASSETASDGVTVDDLAPPTIADFKVDPSIFNPALADTQFTAKLTDSTRLTQWRIEIFDANNHAVWTTQRPLNQARFDLEAQWNGLGDEGGALSEGPYLARLIVADLADQTAVAEAAVTLDATAPAPPIIWFPADRAILWTTRPPIRGSAEAGAEVTVYEAGTLAVLCATQSDADGQFACRSETALTLGWREFAAVATDAAGNASEPSAIVRAIIIEKEESDPGCRAPDGCNIGDWRMAAILFLLAPLRRRKQDRG
ncbi:MAG: VCBS repeat-containing protein [Myxococcales bacterium]|nr:MAG: VCBS repeat-containing protein [Myxococcales bacterium]